MTLLVGFQGSSRGDDENGGKNLLSDDPREKSEQEPDKQQLSFASIKKDFSSVERITPQGFLATLFARCSPGRSRFKDKLCKSRALISRELDLVNVVRGLRLQTMVTLGLLTDKQSFFAHKLS